MSVADQTQTTAVSPEVQERVLGSCYPTCSEALGCIVVGSSLGGTLGSKCALAREVVDAYTRGAPSAEAIIVRTKLALSQLGRDAKRYRMDRSTGS